MNVSRLCVFLLVCGLRLAASDFCALQVTVVDSSGQPASVPVALLDSKGEVVEGAVTRGGHTQFCDFGFGLHSVRVQNRDCGFIVRDRVLLVNGVTQEVRVTLDCKQGEEASGVLTVSPSCPLYLRVQSDSAEKLSGASATVPDRVEPYRADVYGRIFGRIRKPSSGVPATIMIGAPGYVSSSIAIAACSASEQIERLVTLKPLR